MLKASKAELYLTAVMHYLTLRRLPAHEHARPPLLEGKLVPWLVELGSVAEFESLLAPLVSSRTSLSEVDAADVAWFIRQYRGDVFRLLPGDVPFREIRALVGGALVQHVAGDARVDEFLDRNVETATDALRLAVALSGGDVSLTTATTRFAPMKRGVRRLLLRLLDRAPNAVEDVMRHAERWKRLAEVLHRATTPTNTRAPWRPSRRRGATTRRPRSGRASRRCWPNGTSPRSRPCCNNVPANSRAGWT